MGFKYNISSQTAMAKTAFKRMNSILEKQALCIQPTILRTFPGYAIMYSLCFVHIRLFDIKILMLDLL